ncbi:MAG TPA: hypothetical protein VFQ96_06960, partial [Microbacteriaceae bacterium]|nr:hypothetical protein [Microbacteriaceae bacterium]
MAEATTAARATAGSRPETHAATHPAAAAARDYARDAVTAFLLVASLFMPWVASAPHGQVATGIAAAHIDVLLVTMVTLVALAIPHLGRVPALGTAWSPDTVRRVRLVIGLPYAVLVIVYLVLALVTQLTLGPALAFGMAGAILAVQPRQRELPPIPRAGRVWLRGTVVVAGLAVVFTLVQIAEMFSIFSANGPAAFILSIVLGLAASGILAVAAVGALTGHRAWRRIGIGLGVAAAVLILLSLNPQLVLVDATLHGPAPTFSLMFWVAFGAAAAAPALGRRLPAVADAGAAWFAVVRVILGLAVSCGILVVIVSSIELSYEQLIGPFAPLAVTEWMIALAVGVLLTAGGVTVWAIGRTKTRSAVEAISVFAGILFVLGLILTVVWSLPSALPFGGAATLAPLIAFAFPAALLGCLWVPASSRARYASLPHGGRSRVSSAEQGRADDDVARTGATRYHDDATQS